MQSGTDSRKGNAVRLADIAREVGVSIVTVAKVLNNTGGKNTRVSEKTASRIRACVSIIRICLHAALSENPAT